MTHDPCHLYLIRISRSCAVQGGSPDFEKMLTIRNAMVRSHDLRQPIELSDQLMHKSGLAQDVGQAMVALLQVQNLPSINPSDAESAAGQSLYI